MRQGERHRQSVHLPPLAHPCSSCSCSKLLRLVHSNAAGICHPLQVFFNPHQGRGRLNPVRQLRSDLRVQGQFETAGAGSKSPTGHNTAAADSPCTAWPPATTQAG